MEMAVSQVNRDLVRPVTIFAALIGTVEALIWTGLTLISILYYNSVLIIDENLPTTSYQRVLYDLFLGNDPNYITDKTIVTPTIFNFFMYFYMALSFVWLVLSLYLFWAMTRNKWGSAYTMVGGWAGITIIISLLDVALMSLVVADFVTVKELYSSSQSTPDEQSTLSTTPSWTVATLPSTTILPTIGPTTGTTEIIIDPSTTITEPTTTGTTLESSTVTPALRFIIEGRITLDATEYELVKDVLYVCYGIVISLAARGYILWIVNVVFACILMKFAYDLKKEEAPSLLPIMDAYAASGRPWNNLYEQTDISNGYTNDAFKDEDDRSMFPRSDSFINSDTDSKNRNPLSNGSNPYEPNNREPSPNPNPNVVNGRVAKIGKSGGRRTPPQNVPPPSVPPSNSPYIPDPDYTPPASPKPKSVLRPKSNYVL